MTKKQKAKKPFKEAEFESLLDKASPRDTYLLLSNYDNVRVGLSQRYYRTG